MIIMKKLFPIIRASTEFDGIYRDPFNTQIKVIMRNLISSLGSGKDEGMMPLRTQMNVKRYWGMMT